MESNALDQKENQCRVPDATRVRNLRSQFAFAQVGERSEEHGVMASSTQCSGCSGEFSWAVAESTQHLFPLLCGEIFCRACLRRQARATLSRRTAPLRCCQKVVPHDFIRMVLAYEEDVYYSFLLNQPRDEAGSGKLPATQKNVKSTPALPLPPKILVPPDDTEMKQPVKLVQDHVTTTGATTVTPFLAGQAEISPVATSTQPPRPRYLTRFSKARRIQAQNSQQSGSTVSPAPGKPPVASSSQSCHICGIAMTTSQIKAPCGHTLCHYCVETDVRSNFNAPNSGVPVSCCDRMLPLHLVQRVIPRDELTRYAKLTFKYTSATTNTTTANARGTKRKADTENMLVAAPAKGKARGSSAPTTKAEQVNNQKQLSERECSSCLSSVSPRARWLVGPCGHGYCRSCLAEMARASLANRNQVPIRCCSKEFPAEDVEFVLTKRQFGKYERFLAERRSSTLLSDQDYAKVVRQVHGKQCPVCGIGVVKISGCHAMQCTLGHIFCWNCLHTQCTCGKIYRYD